MCNMNLCQDFVLVLLSTCATCSVLEDLSLLEQVHDELLAIDEAEQQLVDLVKPAPDISKGFTYSQLLNNTDDDSEKIKAIISTYLAAKEVSIDPTALVEDLYHWVRSNEDPLTGRSSFADFLGYVLDKRNENVGNSKDDAFVDDSQDDVFHVLDNESDMSSTGMMIFQHPETTFEPDTCELFDEPFRDIGELVGLVVVNQLETLAEDPLMSEAEVEETDCEAEAHVSDPEIDLMQALNELDQDEDRFDETIDVEPPFIEERMPNEDIKHSFELLTVEEAVVASVDNDNALHETLVEEMNPNECAEHPFQNVEEIIVAVGENEELDEFVEMLKVIAPEIEHDTEELSSKEPEMLETAALDDLNKNAVITFDSFQPKDGLNEVEEVDNAETESANLDILEDADGALEDDDVLSETQALEPTEGSDDALVLALSSSQDNTDMEEANFEPQKQDETTPAFVMLPVVQDKPDSGFNTELDFEIGLSNRTLLQLSSNAVSNVKTLHKETTNGAIVVPVVSNSINSRLMSET